MDTPPPPLDEVSLASLPDAVVVEHARHGNDVAARELVRRYERPVFNLIARTVVDRSAAEDLTQDAFLKVFRSLHTFDVRLRFPAWILTIAHNTAVDHLRRTRDAWLPLDAPVGEGDDTFEDVLPDPAGVNPEQIALRTNLADAVDAALDRLRPEYRTVLVLRHQEELDYAEIAQITGWPLGTVKTFLRRGRLALARELQQDGWEARPSRAETRRSGGS
jgi:RNA polymerase sigma-70 factor (ECF subfamily)